MNKTDEHGYPEIVVMEDSGPIEEILPPEDFVYRLEEGECAITGLPTHYIFQGEWISEHFILAAEKLFAKYKDEEGFTKFKAMEVLLSAQVDRAIGGESALDPRNFKQEKSWKEKLKSIIKIH